MSERLRRIVEGMAIKPDDRILEIGCGHGVAVSLMGEYLKRGFITAIDRSQRMIESAQRRNAKLVALKRVEFFVAEFEAFDPGDVTFDKILAVRVGLFHREPARARVLASRWLKDGGKLFVEYDEPKTLGGRPTRRSRRPQ